MLVVSMEWLVQGIYFPPLPSVLVDHNQEGEGPVGVGDIAEVEKSVNGPGEKILSKQVGNSTSFGENGIRALTELEVKTGGNEDKRKMSQNLVGPEGKIGEEEGFGENEVSEGLKGENSCGKEVDTDEASQVKGQRDETKGKKFGKLFISMPSGRSLVKEASNEKMSQAEQFLKNGEKAMRSSLVNHNVGESTDGVSQLKFNEKALPGSHLMSKDELKQFNYLKGKEVKEKFKNDQFFRQNWMDRENNFASEMLAASELHEKSLKGGMLEEVVNTETTKKEGKVQPPRFSTEQTKLEMSYSGICSEARPFLSSKKISTSKKESQGRAPEASIEQTKKVKDTCGGSSVANSVLTMEELTELGKITTLSIRNNFRVNSDYRREWMERNVILDTASSLEGPENFDSEDSDDDGFNEKTLYANCDSETLAHALSLGGRKSRFRARNSKGSRRHWG